MKKLLNFKQLYDKLPSEVDTNIAKGGPLHIRESMIWESWEKAGGVCGRCGVKLVFINRDLSVDGGWSIKIIKPPEEVTTDSTETEFKIVCWECSKKEDNGK